MKLIDKAKQAAMEGAVTKALEYLEKDPETNIPKLMDLVDTFTPENWYKSQRDAIRNAIQDKNSNWFKGKCKTGRSCKREQLQRSVGNPSGSYQCL